MECNVLELEKAKRNAILKGNWTNVVKICNELAVHYASKGNYKDACEYHEEELKAAERLGDVEAIALAHRLLGENQIEIGQHKQALENHKLFLKLTKNSLKSKLEEQRAWATLGRTYYTIYTATDTDLDYSKDTVLTKAENSYFKAGELADALHCSQELNDKEHGEMKARILLNFGLIYEQKGDTKKCQDCMKQAIFLCNKFNLQEDLHRCQFSLAVIYQNRDIFELALQLIDDAIKSASVLKQDLLMSDCYMVKARVLLCKDNYNDAKEFARKAYKCAPEGKKIDSRLFYQSLIGVKTLFDKVCTNDGDISKNLEKLGDGLAYIGLYKKAIEKYHDIIDSNHCIENLAPIYYSIAETYADDKQYEKSIEYFNKEIDLNISIPKEQVRTLLRVANVYEKMGLDSEVINTYEKAKAITESLHDEVLQVQVLKELKFYMEETKHPDLLNVSQMVETVQQLVVLPDSEELLESESKPDMFSHIIISDSSDDDSKKQIQPRPKRTTYKVRKNEKGETPLHRACISGNLKQVRNLIEKGHPINERDNCGWLPIHEACNFGFNEIVECLLEHGARVNDPGGELCGNITPLHDAAVGGHFEIVELLLKNGAAVTSKNKDGLTPLDNLYQWRDDNEDATHDDLAKFAVMENKLKEKMIENGVNPGKRKRKRNDNSGWVEDSLEIDIVPMEQELAFEINEDENVYNPFTEDLENDLDDPDVARREYQTAISNVRKRSKTNTDEISVFEPIPSLIEEDNLITDDWLIEDVRPVMNKPKKLKQTKLNCSVLRKPRERNYKNSSSSSYKNSTRRGSSDLSLEDFNDCLNIDDNNFATNVHAASMTNMHSIKIKIKDRVLIIPIQDFDKTFAWLGDEASERYNTQTGMKPNLILQRMDGAMFSPSDAIGTMLQNGSEIQGVIQSWNQPPLSERYQKNCLEAKFQPSAVLLELLKHSEESRIISLENVLSHFPISPFLKATRYQFSLKSLLLQAVDITNENNVTLLCQSIATLPNLTQLKLECCGLNASFFHELQESLDDDLKIQEFSLDYNDFSNLNEHIKNVTKVLNKTKILEKLSLKYCQLSSNFFKSNELKSCISGITALRCCSITGNPIGINGIKEYLKLIPQVTHLDFSGTQNGPGICEILGNYFNILNHTIQSLSLKSCFLNNSELNLLSNCLPFLSQIEALDISDNPELTQNCLLSFLKECKIKHVPIVSLNLEGTLRVTLENVNWFSDLLQLKYLRNIYVTCVRGEVENELKLLWKNLWAEKAICKRHDFSSLKFISL